jgi:hypothetical protein
VARGHGAGPLKSFLVTVDALPEKQRGQLSAQTFATPEKVRSLVVEFDKQLRSQGQLVAAQLALYLNNAKTELIILDSVKTDILDVYNRFFNVLTGAYTDEELQVVGLPSLEQVRMTFLPNDKRTSG